MLFKRRKKREEKHTRILISWLYTCANCLDAYTGSLIQYVEVMPDYPNFHRRDNDGDLAICEECLGEIEPWRLKTGKLLDRFPELNSHSECPLPDCDEKYSTSMINRIEHLNDSHHWSFTQIADWLETL